MSIDYDGRHFRPVDAHEHEEGRVAVYRQAGDLLWGEFTGGRARHGSLSGTCAPDGSLDFAYCMVLDDGGIVSGRCRSTPTVLPDDRIRLHETWERYSPRPGRGESAIEEIPTPRSNP
jgi:hypothetical protein